MINTRAALEQWALDGQDCGAASLNVRSIKGPHAVFAGRYALPAAEQRYKIGRVMVRVVGPDGKVLRRQTLTAREGYGPVPLTVSLAGAARLDLFWPDRRVIVFAMTQAWKPRPAMPRTHSCATLLCYMASTGNDLEQRETGMAAAATGAVSDKPGDG